MNRITLLLALLAASASAQTPTGALKTSDVGIDQAGVCWVRGPANALKQVGPTGGALSVTATTVLPTAGYWLVISAGVPTVVNANGTSTAAGAIGTAYPVSGL